jgi:hypothetical protein
MMDEMNPPASWSPVLAQLRALQLSRRLDNGTSAGVSTTSIAKPSAEAMRCRRKFLRFFPGGFYDETYIDWERGYKWAAHEQWAEVASLLEFASLVRGDLSDLRPRDMIDIQSFMWVQGSDEYKEQMPLAR